MKSISSRRRHISSHSLRDYKFTRRVLTQYSSYNLCKSTDVPKFIIMQVYYADVFFCEIVSYEIDKIIPTCTRVCVLCVNTCVILAISLI